MYEKLFKVTFWGVYADKSWIFVFFERQFYVIKCENGPLEIDIAILLGKSTLQPSINRSPLLSKANSLFCTLLFLFAGIGSIKSA